MDNCGDLVYFVNSQGRKAVLSSPENQNYWELRGRSGFTAPEVENFSVQMASGITKYFGKTLKPRICTMKMVCTGKNTAERDRIFFDMLDVLLDVSGTGEGKLYVKRSDGATVWLRCVYSDGMNIIEQYQKLHLFTLTFFACDPWFYGAEKKYSLDGLLNSPYTIKVSNQTKNDMQVKLLVNNNDHTWSFNGRISNQKNGSVIKFKNVSTYKNFEASFNRYDEYYRLTDYYSGDSVDGRHLLDWLETDPEFCIVPGDNIISGSSFSASGLYADSAWLIAYARYSGA